MLITAARFIFEAPLASDSLASDSRSRTATTTGLGVKPLLRARASRSFSNDPCAGPLDGE